MKQKILSVVLCFVSIFSVEAQNVTEKKFTPKDHGLRNYEYLSIDLPHKEDTTWILTCQMPHNCQYQMWIEFDAPVGAELTFKSSNFVTEFMQKQQTYITTKSGLQTYEIPNWISGEGATYVIPKGVTVKAVKYRETGFDTEFAGGFSCNDEDYNILWQKATRTCYICMRDHFMDCPDRERTPVCLGDVCIQNEEVFYLFDTNAHLLVKDAIKRAPNFTGIIDQNLMFAGETGTWFYYMNTGDLETIKEQYPNTKEYLDRWELDESGMAEYYTKKGQNWTDWGSPSRDRRIVQTIMYYYTLGTLRKMAVVTDNKQDLPEIDAKLESIKNNFDKLFWSGDYYITDAVSYPDERANALAVVAGLASPDKWNSIYEKVLSQKLCPTWYDGNTYNASCYFERWIMEALIIMGKEEFALLRMYDRYKPQINGEFTTLTEHFGRWWQTKFDPNSTINHGWNSPNTILSRFITGVEPVEAGWSRFKIMPKEAFLNNIKTDIETVKGHINIAIDKTSSQYCLSFNVPSETTAEIGIPKKGFTKLDDIRVNDKLVWDGEAVKRKGVKFISEDNEYIRFSIEPGVWSVVAEGSLDVSSPKEPREEKVKGEKLDEKAWTVTASKTNIGPNHSYLIANKERKNYGYASEAIDGDNWTNWSIGMAQSPDQWFKIDLGQVEEFDHIELNTEWAPYDFPRFLSVFVSDDGVNWGKPIVQGRGTPYVSDYKFPRQKKRYILLKQEGVDTYYWWSIFELNIYKPM